MPATDCRHREAADVRRSCVHLLDADASNTVDLYKRFTGRGREYELLCSHCKHEPEVAGPSMRRVCVECCREIEDEVMWDGVIGQPEVLVRPSDLEFEHEVVRVADQKLGAILDIRPLEAETDSVWVAVTSTGRFVRFDLTRATAEPLAHLPVSEVSLGDPVTLHLSAQGELAAVVNSKGRHGVVSDLQRGRPTMLVGRGEYRVENSEFSVAFFEHAGRTLLVHATDWNRLDISDPVTGRLLTDRQYTAPRDGESVPEHYSQYFRGSLSVSRDQEWIADDAWVWGAAGIPRTWSLRKWVEANVWESEDGPSVQSLCQRWYGWDMPMCWVGNRTLAVWGYGTDVDALIPAAWLFDVGSGEEVGWFAGPTGAFFFDKYLFSCSERDGTAVWDVATGAQQLLDPELRPTRYHRGAKQFLTILPDGAFRLSRLVNPRLAGEEHRGAPPVER